MTGDLALYMTPITSGLTETQAGRLNRCRAAELAERLRLLQQARRDAVSALRSTR